ARVQRLDAAGSSTPRGGSSAARSSARHRHRPLSSSQSPGSQGPSLRSGRRCRRRPQGWVVAGRADRAAARLSWRAGAAPPSGPVAAPTMAWPAVAAVMSRRSSFRPFISAFGVPAPRSPYSPRGLLRPRPPSPTPPAAPATALGGTLPPRSVGTKGLDRPPLLGLPQGRPAWPRVGRGGDGSWPIVAAGPARPSIWPPLGFPVQPVNAPVPPPPHQHIHASPP
uniref:Uncharacterized protein n=1 Tax=Aegilops tauschii subsp. strangulata TaxID=200361 RepID=A0A453NQ08_AEGTS